MWGGVGCGGPLCSHVRADVWNWPSASPAPWWRLSSKRGVLMYKYEISFEFVYFRVVVVYPVASISGVMSYNGCDHILIAIGCVFEAKKRCKK